ncbi:hypothetical protein HDE_09127 [Halotydeus destructor]|nr:hypothetical protein HDE_09127 [Halotydeus destructor]
MLFKSALVLVLLVVIVADKAHSSPTDTLEALEAMVMAEAEAQQEEAMYEESARVGNDDDGEHPDIQMEEDDY